MIRKYWPVIALFVLVISLFITNYSPGTWLSGWDNLHPEFNLPLNIKRSLFAVWQEYQGLGLLGGMGHAADLPRQFFMWLISFLLPPSVLRYLYHFLMLFVGPLGVYFLLKNILLESLGVGEEKKKLGGFLGAIFYLFNLSTLQMFYAPFEAYSHHYGFLPWLVFSYLNYLDNGKKNNLISFFILSIIAVPQAYIGTFFLIYMMIVSIISIIYFIQHQNCFKKIIVCYLIIFCINAFWFLPNIYFLYKNVGVNLDAKINQMSTQDVFLRNKKYGNLTNTMLLKGFWFDNVEMDKDGVTRYQMDQWKKYFDYPIVTSIGYFMFISILLGIFYSFKKRISAVLSFIPVLLFSFILLSNDTPILNFITSLFYKIPLFSQIFRFPFTKFSILTAFCFSIFFSLSYFALSSLTKKLESKIFFIFLLSLPILFLFPIFNGNLFYSKVRAKIPDEYFQVFNFFQKQKDISRIANFPQYTFWGWTFYNWNYSGSGFLWYGIENPVLDRAFDVWSRENENYYNELSYALYSGNSDLLDSILNKYQIEWLLVDGNIISYASGKTLYLDNLEQLLSSSTKIHLVNQFGRIKIYKNNLQVNPKKFFFIIDNLPSITPKYKWNNYDKAYEDYGNYITDNRQQITVNKEQKTINNQQAAINNVDIYYPFRSLFTGRQQNELEFGVDDTADYFSFKTKIPKELMGYKLEIPSVELKEATELDTSNLSKVTVKTPQIYIDGEFVSFASSSANIIDFPNIKDGNFEVRMPKINGYYGSVIQPTTYNLEPRSCDQFNIGIYKHDQIDINSERLLQLTSINSSNCLDFDLPNLSQDIGYLVTVENRNVEGKSLLFSVINKNSQRADIETYLPKKQLTIKNQQIVINKSYFVIPPMEQFGLGYTLHLDNISIGRVKTINDLGKITVNPIPYRFLAGLKVIKSAEQLPITNYQLPISVDHPNPSFYQVTLTTNYQPSTINKFLTLSQSYDAGWHAYEITNDWLIDSWYMKLLIPLFGKEIKNHVLVNNWENGWKLSDNKQQITNNNNTTIVIVYLPQYLEYLGFLLLGVGVLIVIFYPEKSNLSTNKNSVIARNEMTKQSL